MQMNVQPIQLVWIAHCPLVLGTIKNALFLQREGKVDYKLINFSNSQRSAVIHLTYATRHKNHIHGPIRGTIMMDFLCQLIICVALKFKEWALMASLPWLQNDLQRYHQIIKLNTTRSSHKLWTVIFQTNNWSRINQLMLIRQHLSKLGSLTNGHTLSPTTDHKV